jgi:hypothetical protein
MIYGSPNNNNESSMVLKMSLIFNCFFNGTCSFIHDTLLILILGSYIVLHCILWC